MELILQYVLPSILGDFISGIDKNHMKTNFLSGKVSLQGVSLNPAIVENMNLPFKIVYSNIGQLEMKIPWLQRMKQPMELYLEDLLVILEQDSTVGDFNIIDERVKFLDALLKECKNKLVAINKDFKKEESSMDYYKVLILDNLQVTIKNIHIRLENPSKGYACGFTLDQVNMNTINEKGQPEFLDRTLEENKMKDLYKKLLVQDISVYWKSDEDPACFVGSQPLPAEQKKLFLKGRILRNGQPHPHVQPILSLSLESYLVLKNINKENQEKDARYRLEVELKPINITLDNNQVNQMIALMNFMNKIERERKKKHKLPQLTVEEYKAEATLYQKILTAFLDNIEEPEINWQNEFEKTNQRDLVIELKRLLAILPNEIIASKSRSVMLKYQKKQLLNNLEKKMNKKGFFGFKTDTEMRKDNEELEKIEGFFDSFIAEDIERIGANFTKGFVFQAKLKLSEASVFLIDAKSQTQQGILLTFTNTRLNMQFHNSNDYDLSTIEFLLNDVKLSLQKGLTQQSNRKEINLVTRFDPSNKQDFATLYCAVKNFSDGKCAIDVVGQFQGMEFYFIPEFVTCIKKFVTFDKGQDENNCLDLAYEKMADLSKNAQDQLKSMINEYSSTITIAVNWAASHVIVPLNPSLGRESDSWILAIDGFRLYTADSKAVTQESHDTLKLEMNKINMVYVEKLSTSAKVRSMIKSTSNKKEEMIENKYLPLMEETSISMELKILKKNLKKKMVEEPDMGVNFYIGDISVNLNSLFYKKLLELSDCLDFSQESDLNEYLETEKTAIVKYSEGTYKVYFKENMLENKWTEYIMICSGYYLYFFKSSNDIEPAKYVFIKQAHVKQDTKKYDAPNILRIKNKFEEVYLAFEDENSMNSCMEIIKRKNQEYAEQNLEIDLNLTTMLNNMNSSLNISDLPSNAMEISSVDPQQDPKNLLMKVNVLFEGLNMNLYEEFDKRIDHVSLKKLSIEYFERPYDQTLRIQLANIHIADYTLEQEIMILSSDSEGVNSGTEPTKELIVIDVRFLQDRHPDYKTNLTEKEFSIAFNSLYINYVPERIYALMNFFMEPLSSPEDKNEPQSPNVSPVKYVADDSKEEEEEGGGPGDLQYIAKKGDVRFMVGHIKVNELSMMLFTQISHIKLAKVSLQNLSMDVNVDKNTSTYKGSLKNIQVFDLTNYHLGPETTEIVPYEVVGIEKGLSVLEFEFIQHHESYMKEISTDVEYVFHLVLNSIRLNYVNQQVLRISNYIFNFILDFEFAEIYTYEEKLSKALKGTKNPTFTSIGITLNHPKVILQAKPNSEVYFELDLDLLSITTERFQSKERILKPLTTLEYVYCENYVITTSDIVLTKKFRDGGSIWLSNPFKLHLVFERCMWYDDYILANYINQEDKISTIDNSYTLKGKATPIFLKFNQEDYLDVMDAINLNLIFEDMKDAMYHIEPEKRPELKYLNVSSQINVMFSFDYLAVIAMDQLTHSPLAKLVALDTVLDIILYREGDKDIVVKISKLSAHHYEQNPISGQYIEKTLLGQLYKERETLIKDADSVEETFNADLIESEKRELERDVDNLIKIEFKMYANKDRDLIMNVQQLKMILNVKVLLRLKDFFIQEDETEENKNEVQLDFGYKSKSHYRGIIEKAEISIPTSIDTALILRSSIQFDFIQYDVTDIWIHNQDFIEASVMNLNLYKSEIFVFRDKNRDKNDEMQGVQKRSIILPLSVTYKSKESLCYEASNNKLLAQNDNLLAIDKVILKVSSTDSMVIAAAGIILEQQYEKYEKLPPFVQQSREVLAKMQLITTKRDLPQITILSEKHKVFHDGIQMRVINDLSGVSVPLLDLSLHSSHDNSALQFEKSLHLLQGKNIFMASSSFYNSKVGKWEPIIEKWEFKLETEFGAATEYNQKIDILNENQDPLNINISDEMVKIILRTWREWNEGFNQFRNPLRKQSLTSAQVSAKLHKISQDLTTQEISNVEQVSPFTIWNDTGYPLYIESHIAGARLKGVACKDRLDLKPGEQLPLIVEMTADRIFEASTRENILERLKVSVNLQHPVYGLIAIPNIDVHNFGVKKRRIELKDIKKICPIVCHVYTHKKKKFVRFSSPIIIENGLPKPLVVQLEGGIAPDQDLLIIEPNTSVSIPFDQTYNNVAFAYDNQDPTKKPEFIKLEKLFSNTMPSISIGEHHALLRSQFWQTHAKIFFEPLLTIKNCLPCPIGFEILGKKGSQEKEVNNKLQPQEKVQITEFSGDFQAKLKLTVDKFITNEYYILPVDNKLTQTMYLHNHRDKVPLNVTIMKSNNGTYNIMISAKTLVLNESEESLHFLGHNETSSWISPFTIPCENGQEIVLFDDIAAMKIKPKTDKSSMSEAIPLNQLGMFTADCYDKEKENLNIGVHVRNQLCDKAYNLFTKVISILPRYVVVNQTSYMISFYQIELPDKPTILIPGERSSFHFSKDSRDRFIKVRINGSEDNQQWKDSGSLDVSGPGNFDFIIQNAAQTQDKYFNILTSMQDASLFINLQEQDPSDTLIQIKNSTSDGEIIVNQQGIYDTKYSVLPHTTLPFAWLQPCLNNTMVFRLISNNKHSPEFSIKLDELTKSLSEKPAFETEYEKVNYRFSLSGRSRVIEFYPAKKQMKKNSGQGNGEIKLLFRICLPSLGISLISTASQKKCELAYISLTPLMFAMVNREESSTIQLRIKSITIDNNFSRDVQYPVILFPHNAAKLKELDLPHFDFICKIRNSKKSTDILYIHDFQFYLAKTNICLDGHTVNAITDFVRNIDKSLEKDVYDGVKFAEFLFLSEKEKKNLHKSYHHHHQNVCITWRNLDPAVSTSDFVYFEKLAIQLLMFNITFKNPQFDFGGSYFSSYLKNALGKALANLDNVPIKLTGIDVTSMYSTKDQALDALGEYYKNLLKASIFKLIFSANIIGNPIKLFGRISNGVNDLIDKPVQGFLEGPLQGGIGIIGGVGSLAAKTVGATFNSLHSITDSLANGLSNLSGDKEYIEKREKTNAKSNSNVLTGSVQAVKSIGKGLFSGITGVVEKPISGAKKGGVGGLFKGMYVGAKGLAIKPVAGVLDGVSKLTEGVSNTIDKDTSLQTSRMRFPRAFYGKERIFKSYNISHMYVMNFLMDKNPKKYSDLTLLEIVFLDQKQKNQYCLVLTLERVFLISMEKKSIAWKVKSEKMKESFRSEDGIEIILKKPTKAIPQQLALIPCKDSNKKTEIYTLLHALHEVVEDTLEKKRIRD